ncbi:MAG: SpoIID/LytB domain-containing protein [Candidatus Levybacteria bacterium]|nr:SpoIID/LytB domain-containing protein [Candidatus Levybacteria bacterium]
MKRFLPVFLLSIFIVILGFLNVYFSPIVKAQDDSCSNTSSLNLDAISRCLESIQKAYNMSVNATRPLESELQRMQKQINGIKARVSQIEQDIIIKKANIDSGYENLAKQQLILNRTISDFYIKSYYNSPFLVLLSAPSASKITQVLAYQKAATDQDKAIITNIALSIQDLETKKVNLENEQERLISIKTDLDTQSAKLDKIISGAKAYQSVLSGQIASLTAKQEEILNAKSGTFTTSVGDVPLADDPNASPNYNPGFSPAFAGFSFGAFTHRNGMSQYGAKGRANQGQSAEQILAFYYPGANLNKSYGVPSTIDVIGYGPRAFEDEYMKRIYEMPNSFPKEALKAQAVAARTYAIRQGGSICATESCQVYKDENKGGAWEEAANETRGWVLEGGPNAQYSSTTGGYSNNSGWDTTSGNKDTWTSGAYEKIAGSPWFYKGWYTQNYSISSNKCGRTSPWLNTEEMSDILNAYLIQNKGSVDNGRITPITTSCWGGNPYSMGETRDLAANVGGGNVSSISNISVTYSNDGKTANITFSTNRGDISIGGSDFKQIFNLRAPGYISIKSVLFNVERK